MSDGEHAIPWERIKSLFADALELEGDARAAFLDRAARGEPALRREVESLLAAHERSGALMAAPTLPDESWRDMDVLAPPPDGQAGGQPSGRPAGGRVSSPLPERLGRYRILSLLGVGGMGEVYLAHDPLLERDVALKVLPADLAEHPQRRSRFLREARAAASLNHPNITTIHEVGEAEGRDYIAFEHVQGRSLRELLIDHTPGLQELVDIAVPLADALAYAHERGIIHRDVKTANVMVTERGLPKLLDFGLAKLVHVRDASADDEGAAPAAASAAGSAADSTAVGDSTGDAATLAGTISGTPGAMSPEQALGKPVDHRTDVFSLGSLLYEMASGRPAFAGKSAMDTMEAVIRRAPQPLKDVRADLPPEFISIVAKALRKDPAERYQKIADMAADLRHFKRATEIGLLPGLQRRRGPWVAAALGGLLAAAALLAWWNGWLREVPIAPAPPPARYAAVMYFESPADPADADGLGAMLARLLTTHLSTSSGIEMLSQQRLFDVARQLGKADGRVDGSIATEVARTADVGTMILGQVSHAGGALVATTDVVDVTSGRTLASHQARGATAADVFAMAESLGRQVRDTLRAPALSDAENRALAEQLTTSAEAYRAYVRGLEALQRSQIEDAAAAFRRATEIDPAFALAHYRLGMALVWTGRAAETASAIEKATAFRDKLPENIRLLLEGARPYFVGNDMRAALPPLLTMIEREPDNADALYILGEIYTHSAALNDTSKAVMTYERLLDIDPALSLVYEHLLTAYLRAGRFDAARARVAAWESSAPSNLDALRGTLALWEGRFDEAATLLGDQPAPPILAERWDAPALRAATGATVDGIVEGLKDLSGLYLVVELDLRAALMAYRGKFAAAADLYRRAAEVPGATDEDSFLTSACSSARHKLAFVLALQGDLPGARREVAATLALQPDSFRCLLMEAFFALRDQDQATARNDLALLTELAGRGWSPTAGLYRDAVAAELALSEGRAQEARDGFAALVGSGRLMEDWYAYEDSVGPLLRDGLARACLAAGDAPGAAAALDGLIQCGFERLRHPVPWVLAMAARGTMELDAGHEQAGRELLGRFLDCWGQADADLPQVAAARARLQAPR